MNKLLIAVPAAIAYYGMHRLVKTLKQYSSAMETLQHSAAKPATEKPYVPCQCKQFDEDRIHTESVCYPKREGTDNES